MAFPKLKLTNSAGIKAALTSALVIIALLAPNLASARSKKTKKPKARNRIEFLKTSEIKRLSPKQRADYFDAFQKAMVHFDQKSRLAPASKSNSKKKALLWWLMPNALAIGAGDSCWPGGYYSELATQADGSLVCNPPPDSTLWDEPTGGFFCGTTDTGERKAFCNSALFLTGRDSKQFCVPVTNQTENCRNEFLREFGQSNGVDGDPNYPARLTQAYHRLASIADTTTLDAFYAEAAAHIEYALANNDPRAEEFDRLRAQIGYMRRAKELAASAPASTGDSTGAPPAPAATPASLAPEKSKRPVARPNRNGTPSGSPEPSPSATPTPNVLGRELSCVQGGLKSLGHEPSERYIALVGTAVQAFNGTYNLNDEASRKAYQARVISMIRTHGYCDQSSYPPIGEDSDVTLIRRWITADNGAIRSERRLGYIARGVERGTGAELAAKRLCQTFGFGAKDRSCERSGITDAVSEPFEKLFRIQEDAWDSQTLEARQSAFTSHQPSSSSDKSAFDECHANLVKRTKSDPAFKLSALTNLNKDGVARDEARQVAAKNRETCEAMAKSCDLDLAVACQAPGPAGTAATPAPTTTATPPSSSSDGATTVK